MNITNYKNRLVRLFNGGKITASAVIEELKKHSIPYFIFDDKPIFSKKQNYDIMGIVEKKRWRKEVSKIKNINSLLVSHSIYAGNLEIMQLREQNEQYNKEFEKARAEAYLNRPKLWENK